VVFTRKRARMMYYGMTVTYKAWGQDPHGHCHDLSVNDRCGDIGASVVGHAQGVLPMVRYPANI